MNINRDNYEKYFIDYLDGTLSPDLIHDLHTFLLLNEDLSALLEGMEVIKLTPPPIKYAFKENLKKDLLHACPDYYAIASAEASLTTEDQTFLNRSLQKNNIEKEKTIYQQLKLKPDTTIYYPKKSKLYHPSYRKFWYRYCSVAAVFLFILSSGILLLQTNEQEHPMPIATLILPTPDEIPPIEYPVFMEAIGHSNTPQSRIQTPRLRIKRIPVAQIRELPIPKITQTVTNDWDRIQIISSPTDSELILSENAVDWKPSESNFFTDNIFSSVFHAGKIITESIKNNTIKE